MRCLISILFAALTVPCVPAQNIVKNSGFETSATSFAPWAIRRGDQTKFVNPRVIENAKVGWSDDRAMAFRVGWDRVAIQQSVTVPRSGFYDVSASVRYSNVALRSSSEALVLSMTLATSTSSQTIWRYRASTFSPSSAAPTHTVVTRLTQGTYDLVLEFDTSTASRLFPVLQSFEVDDVIIAPVTQADPFVTVQTVSSFLSRSNLIRTSASQSSIPIVIYASTKRLARPLRVPGFEGLFELDSTGTGGLLLVGTGVGSVTTSVPVNIMTLLPPVYLQAIEAGVTQRRLKLGSTLGVRVRL